MTYTGLTNGDTAPATLPSINTPATVSSDAGVYPITATGAADPNYNITYLEGILTIEKATLSVTAENKIKVHGDANPALTISYIGFVGADDKNVIDAEPSVSTSALPFSTAGTYPIVPSGGLDNNYTFIFIDGTLTITKASLLFTAENKGRIYNTPNPDLTFTISGFVNSETQAVIDALPSISTTAIQNSSAGTYPIIMSGGNDDNYSFSFTDGIFTITKADQTVSYSSFPEKVLMKNTIILTASSTSGLSVEFQSLDPQFATVSGNILTAVSAGNARIRAYNIGDQNYNPAETIETTEVYSTHKNIMNLFTPNNDGINDYWELPDLDSWGKSEVKVYNRWGKLVFSEKEYQNRWDGTSDGSSLPEGPYYFIIDTQNAGVVKGTVNIVR
ncbi:MAG: gliding motility-associated C-terminal domain-containing protein [Bacteroidetes bacterium]|nr:gliding motility-associated C-terminal domain-containing protein [Bacteroidota bacterium]